MRSIARLTEPLRRHRLWYLAAGALVAGMLLVAAGCGGGDEAAAPSEPAAPSDTSAPPADTSAAPAEASAAHLPITAPTECGGPVVFQKTDPDGVLAALVAEHPELESWYAPHFAEVHGSPWTGWEGKPPPWTIGYVSFPTDNPWKVGLLDQFNKEIDELKAAGLVDDFKIYMQPDWATATPEQQVGAIQQMVNEGVDLILVHPLSATAEAAAFDEAGKAGVPIVLTGDIAPSEYSVNVNTFNQGPGFSDFFKMMSDQGWFKGEPRTTLEIRGIEGNTFEQTSHDAAFAAMEPCPGIDVVGQVWGAWNAATTKEEVLKFLASHPENIDFIMHEGAMAGGVIQAFEEAGRAVPPMPISGTTGGDLWWWCENKDAFQSVGYHFSGPQMAHATMGIAIRMLNGQSLKIADIAPLAVKVTNDNICDVKPPDATDVTYVGDVQGAVEDYLSDEEFDWFFETPGNPLAGG